MAVESAADRAALLDVDEFGSAATYNGSTTVNGIFENEYFEALADGEVAVEGTQPRFTCRTADVPSAAHGDTLLISGTTYNVVGVQPDGTGMSTLALEEQ